MMSDAAHSFFQQIFTKSRTDQNELLNNARCLCKTAILLYIHTNRRKNESVIVCGRRVLLRVIAVAAAASTEYHFTL